MLDFGFKSDTGKVRDINQDAFFVMPEEGLFLVADGVGGHNYGELASRMTMKYIAGFIRENPISDDAGEEQLRDYFLNLVLMVNEYIYDIAKRKAPKGMATTLIILYIKNDAAYVVNVGDSRAYLIRDNILLKVTEDHTFVNDLVKKGVITEAQAETHPDRNMITRAVGADVTVKPDFYMFEIYKDDMILLCTDGMYNEVAQEDICRIMKEEENMRLACAKLVETANINGGGDNITVVSVKI